MNDTDLEKLLNESPLQRPSAGLDRRMAQLFVSSPARRSSWPSRPVPLWLTAASLLVVGAAGYLGGHWRSQSGKSAPTTAPIVYIIQNDARAGSLDASERRPGFLSQPGNIRVEFHGGEEIPTPRETNNI